MKRSLHHIVFALATVLTATLLLPHVQAADGTWIGTSTGSSPNFGALWSTAGNWVSNQIAGTVGTTDSPDTLDFTIQGHYTIELDDNYNVKYIISDPGAHGHAIATQTDKTLGLTDGGSITGYNNGQDKYFAPIRLEGGNGGAYTFSGSNMKIYAPVTGTATAGNYDLILAGSGTTNEVTTSGSYVGSIGNGTGGGTLSVIKAGTGAWSLVNANTYTGTTTLRNGTLRFSNANSFGTGTSAIQLSDASTGVSDNLELRWNENITLSRDIVVNNFNSSGTTILAVRDNRGGPELSGSLTLNRDIQFVNTLSGSLTVSGVIQGSGGFTKLGENRLTLSNANTFEGDAILSSGELGLDNINALQNSTLDAQAGNVTFNVSGTQTYNLGGLKGSDDITLNDDSISVGSNGDSTTFSGALLVGTGGGGLTKTGTGTLTLSGDNTYTGTTAVTQGTLLVNGTHTGGGKYTVGSNAILGGTDGVITADVEIQDGGTLSPGSSIGALTINGDVTFGEQETDSSTLLIEVGSGTGDLLTISGNLSHTGTLTLDLSGGYSETPILSLLPGQDNYAFDVIKYNGDTVTESAFDDYALGDWYHLEWDGNGNLFLIPEPASALLLALAGLVLLRRRWRW